MKFKRIIFIVLGVMAIFILGMLVDRLTFKNEKPVDIKQENYRFVTMNEDTNEELYFEKEKIKIYFNGIASIKDEGIELKDKYNTDYFNELLNNMEYTDTEKEYIRYMDFGKYSKEGFSIIKCNQVDNYYIGPKNLEYKNSMCANPKVGKTIIKTYEVYSIVPSNDDKYIYITIRAFQGEDTAAVKVKSSLNENIEVGKNYEFTFKITDNYVEDNIASIFANLELLKIEYTDKTGLVQINDNIWDIYGTKK